MESCRRSPRKKLSALTQQMLLREEGARGKESADLLARLAAELNGFCPTPAPTPGPTMPALAPAPTQAPPVTAQGDPRFDLLSAQVLN